MALNGKCVVCGAINNLYTTCTVSGPGVINSATCATGYYLSSYTGGSSGSITCTQCTSPNFVSCGSSIGTGVASGATYSSTSTSSASGSIATPVVCAAGYFASGASCT